MKKWLKIIIALIILLIIIIAIYIIDNIRIVEKPLDNVLKIAREMDGDNLRDRIYAYTIEEQESKVIVTFHSASDWIKTAYTYYIENDMITKCYKEVHFANKFLAKTRQVLLQDKKVNGNVITGWEIMDNSEQPVDKWLKNLEERLSSFSVKLD